MHVLNFILLRQAYKPSRQLRLMSLLPSHYPHTVDKALRTSSAPTLMTRCLEVPHALRQSADIQKFSEHLCRGAALHPSFTVVLNSQEHSCTFAVISSCTPIIYCDCGWSSALKNGRYLAAGLELHLAFAKHTTPVVNLD